MYKPLGKLTESTSLRGDIRQLFDSVFLENWKPGWATQFYVTAADFRRLLVSQEAVEYYRSEGGALSALAICDRCRERAADGKETIFFGWPLFLGNDFESSPQLILEGPDDERVKISLKEFF